MPQREFRGAARKWEDREAGRSFLFGSSSRDSFRQESESAKGGPASGPSGAPCRGCGKSQSPRGRDWALWGHALSSRPAPRTRPQEGSCFSSSSVPMASASSCMFISGDSPLRTQLCCHLYRCLLSISSKAVQVQFNPPVPSQKMYLPGPE